MRLWVPLLLSVTAAFSSTTLSVEASTGITATIGNSNLERYPIRGAGQHSDIKYPTEVKSHRRELYDRYSNSGDDPTPPKQIRIRPFTLILKPSSIVPEMEELPLLHDAIQTVVEQYIRQEATDLDYVLLGDILELTRRNEVQSNGGNPSPTRKNTSGGGAANEVETAMEFPFGVAAFTGPTEDDHNAAQVNAWVKEALEKDLINYVTMDQGSDLYQTFGGIAKAEVISTYEDEADEAREEGETNEISSNLVDGAQVGNYVADDSRRNTEYGIILACIMGSAAIVIAFAFILKRFRGGPIIIDPMDKNSELNIDDAATEMDYAETDRGDATSDISELESEAAHYHHRRALGDGGGSGGSMAGSSVAGHSAPEDLGDAISVASEWTMSTYDESIANGSGSRRVDSVNHAWAASSDNFDRDRQINISKDMLHSLWSSPQTRSAVVSNIRQPKRGDFSSWRTEQGESPAFVFEQANGGGEGEEVYLMPITSPATNSDEEERTFESA